MRKEDEDAPEVGSKSEDKCRDARGRWRKGHCPNPKGRPRKKRFKNYNPSDVQHFANTQIELMVNGQPETLDRRAALLNKIFESAMKGRVSQQRYLMGLFEKKDAELAELRHQYDRFLHEWVLDNPNFKNFDDSLSHEQQLILLKLGATLNHYYPGQFTAFLGIDDTDEDVE